MRYLILVLTVWLCASPALAGPEPVAWSDLVDPSAQTYEDPFAELDYETRRLLVWIVLLRDEAEALPADDPAQADIAAEIETYRDELAAQGHDAEWLLSQRWIVADRRKQAAMAGNPEVDGREVVIAGYAIPAPAAEDGTPVVYLVPSRGMCSHTPPPDPNQMIRARMPADWTSSMMHEPVRLTGQLSIAPSEQAFQIVDGVVPMQSTFDLDVAQVEAIERERAAPPQGNDWAAELAERLRASGQLPALEETNSD